MSYFEDFIEPYIGDIPKNSEHFESSTDYDVKEFAVKIEKKTNKAWLCFICKHKYSAWIPKSLIKVTDVDNDYVTIEIPDWFKFKPLNKVNEVKLGVFK